MRKLWIVLVVVLAAMLALVCTASAAAPTNVAVTPVSGSSLQEDGMYQVTWDAVDDVSYYYVALLKGSATSVTNANTIREYFSYGNSLTQEWHYPAGTYKVAVGISVRNTNADGTYTYTIEYSALKSITVQNNATAGNWDYRVVSGKAHITGYFGTGTAVTVPSALGANNQYPVTAIDAYAFAGTTIKTITLPSTLQNIGTNAFRNCTSLTSITLGANVKVNEFAFFGCASSMTVYGYTGSDAQAAATSAGVKFSALTGTLAAGPAVTIENECMPGYSVLLSAECTASRKAEFMVTTVGEDYTDSQVITALVVNGTAYGYRYISTNAKSVTFKARVYANDAWSAWGEPLTRDLSTDSTLDFDHAVTGHTGTNTVAVAGVTYTLVRFDAVTAGEYAFFTESDDYQDTYGTLYDDTHQLLETDDDGGDDNNFLIEQTLTAGQTVYIGVRFYSADDAGNVALVIEPVDNTIAVPVLTTSYEEDDDRVTVQAAATGAAKIQFQIYDAYNYDTYNETVDVEDGAAVYQVHFSDPEAVVRVRARAVKESSHGQWSDWMDMPTREQALVTEAGLIYKVGAGDGDYCCIIGYEGTSDHVVIPAEIDGVPVYTINRSAFADTNIKSVVISEGVQYIASNAFQDCHQLKTVTIPSTVETIGQYAFGWCYSLTTVTIPDYCEVEWCAFQGCDNLLYAYIGDGVALGNHCFDHCDELTIVGSSGSAAALYADLHSIPFQANDTAATGNAPTITLPDVILTGGEYEATVTGSENAAGFQVYTVWKTIERGTNYVEEAYDSFYDEIEAEQGIGTIYFSTYDTNVLERKISVREFYDDDTYSDWCEPVEIVCTSYGALAKPVVTASATEVAMGDSYTVSWNAVEHATKYTVYVRNGNSTSVHGVSDETSRTITAGMPGTVYVSVEATPEAGYTGSVSSKLTITVTAPTDLAELPLGTEQEITLSAGETKYFAFTAAEDGDYTFYSTGNYDTYGHLYNTSFVQIASNDDGGRNSNFKMQHTMAAGETVYLGARFLSGNITGSFSVIAKKAAEKPVVTLSSGTANIKDEITIRWSENESASYYVVYVNDTRIDETTETSYVWRCDSFGTVRVKVRMVDEDDNNIWSDEVTLTVANPTVGAALTLDETQNVTLGAGEYQVFSFTAPTTNTYYFITKNEENGFARHMVLYSSSFTVLCQDDWEYSYVSRKITAGTTVYLYVAYRDEEAEGSFDVVVYPPAEKPVVTVSNSTPKFGESITVSWTSSDRVKYFYEIWVSDAGGETLDNVDVEDTSYTYVCTFIGKVYLNIAFTDSITSMTVYSDRVQLNGQRPTSSKPLTLDTVYSGSIADGVVQTFSFTAPEAGKYGFYSICTESNEGGSIRLYDSDFNSLAGSSGNVSKNMSAGEAVYVCVAYRDEAASNSFTLVPHKALATPQPTLSVETVGIGDRVTISWPAVENASYYNVSGGGISANVQTNEYIYLCESMGDLSFSVTAYCSTGEYPSSESGLLTFNVGAPTNAEVLNHNASAAVTLGAGEAKLFTFTAPEDGEYVFYSTGNYDTYGYLYDAGFKRIASDDDGGSGSNFKITYTLTAGQKVYLKARFYYSSTSGTFCVMEGNALAVPVVTASTTSASVNENVTLSWNAVDGATHYYVWADNYVLADITDTQYTYTCHVIGSDTVQVMAANDNLNSALGSVTVNVAAPTVTATANVNDVYLMPAALHQIQFVKFTASKAGSYSFYTLGGGDPIGSLYDSSFQQISKADGNYVHRGTNNNFILTKTMAANETVYVGIYMRRMGLKESGKAYLFISRDNEIESMTLTLPNKLKWIEKNAFSNTSAKFIFVPAYVTSIDDTAFSGCEDLVIIGFSDYVSQSFAQKKGFTFVPVNN